MGYVTSVSIEDCSSFKLPLDFIDVEVPGLSKDLLKEKEILEAIPDDDIKHKDFLRLQDLNNLLKKTSITPVTNKYGFNIVFLFDNLNQMNYIDGNEYFFVFKDNIYSNLDEGDSLVFSKTENGFVLNDFGYAHSNYNWVEDKLIKLIETFSLTVTMLDGGDEEHGFVGCEGCERDLNHKVFFEGILQN